MAGATEVLTIALLVVPLVLLGRDQLSPRVRFIPLGLMLLATLLYARDISAAGGSLTQHLFAGEAAGMLALLLGFSIGLTRLEGNEATRWAALCWVLLLGWSTPSEGFEIIQRDLVRIPEQEYLLDWAMIGVGFAVTTFTIPALINAEITPLFNQIFAIAWAILLFDPIGWMLAGLIVHRLVAMRIHAARGAATRRRWMGLMRTFFHDASILVLATAFLAMDGDFAAALWASRTAVGFVLLCGLVGSLLPILGFDANPRPEAWGFHLGMLVAPALLPGIALIEHTTLPVILLAISTPILATHPEFRPDLAWPRRGLESLLLIGSQVVVILLFKPVMALGLLLIPCLVWKTAPADEEE